ncbi:Teichoic acid translocation permease protein TagG [compost metagenome]
MVLIKKAFNSLLSIYKSKNMIVALSIKDFKSKYLGSYLGILWAFIQPAFMILVYWVVFQLGFRNMPIDDFPFLLWLMAAIVPWYFFSDAINNTTSVFLENSYLVKKVVFKISLLPIVKIVSSLFAHLFFIFILIVLTYSYGVAPSVYHFQILYYLIATVALVFSITIITSTLVVFSRDIAQFITMILQVLFWVTPIFWSFDIVPEKYQFFFKINPLFYIVQGYRDSLIHHVGFWHHYNLTIYFWTLICALTSIGIVLYKKMKPHFADIL